MKVELLDKVRDHYNFLTPLIMEVSNENARRWVDPYCGIDWVNMFSPIEAEAWHAIRQFGHAPLYPQYPVFNYFIDFANPAMLVAVECDGKEFHKDKEKDKRRDTELVEKGWTVYRISGKECFRAPSNDYYNRDSRQNKEDILQKFYETTIDGLIKAIGIVHFGYKDYYKKPNEISMARKILRLRRSV